MASGGQPRFSSVHGDRLSRGPPLVGVPRARVVSTSYLRGYCSRSCDRSCPPMSLTSGVPASSSQGPTSCPTLSSFSAKQVLHLFSGGDSLLVLPPLTGRLTGAPLYPDPSLGSYRREFGG